MTQAISNWIKEHQLAAYFILAYAITWAVALSIMASVRGWIGVEIPRNVHFVTSYGPMLSAFLVTAFIGGTAGIR